LWAFNQVGVANAIYQSLIPVVSAVGHEIDLTVADLVADCRALTPSEAAEKVTPNLPELREGLRSLEGQLRTLLGQRLDLSHGKLRDLLHRRAFRLPLERIRDGERRVDDWADRLARAVRQRFERKRDQLGAQAARLESVSPLNVLARGYSLTRSEKDQTVIRNADQVCLGDRLVTYLQYGQVVSRVEETVPTGP
jgi:exodeoxyribonuclease VII large subunit